MMYNPQSDQFVVSAEKIEFAGLLLLQALVNIRETAGLPLDKYKSDPGLLQPADHAQKRIIDAANAIGIDFGGAKWGHEIDLRDFG